MALAYAAAPTATWHPPQLLLQEKFTERYEQSEARVTAALRDMPPVAGTPQ